MYKRNADECAKKVLNLNINKHCGKLKVKCLLYRTTLLLERYKPLNLTMKNYIYLFLLLPYFLVQCDTYTIEEDSRVLITGSVVDAEGNPISGILVRSKVGGPTLGGDVSNLNGDFEFTSLQNLSSAFGIFINLENDKYSTVSYSDITDLQVRNRNAYRLGEIILRRTAALHVQIERISGQNDTLYWHLSFPKPFCRYEYKDEMLLEPSSCYETTTEYAIMYPEETGFEMEYKTLLDETVQFTYRFNSGPENTETLNITQENQTYVFQY